MLVLDAAASLLRLPDGRTIPFDDIRKVRTGRTSLLRQHHARIILGEDNRATLTASLRRYRWPWFIGPFQRAEDAAAVVAALNEALGRV